MALSQRDVKVTQLATLYDCLDTGSILTVVQLGKEDTHLLYGQDLSRSATHMSVLEPGIYPFVVDASREWISIKLDNGPFNTYCPVMKDLIAKKGIINVIKL
jgi:hypothetical protein